MKKYLKNYISDFEKELNIPLMRKEADRPLIEYVVDCWKSLEILKNIKILKWEYSDDESGIDINNHIMKRDKKRKKKDRLKYKFISDDRCGQLTVWIQIIAPELNPETNKTEEKCIVLKKKMLVPIQDEDGYFHIKGKRYHTIYQIVEKSIYTRNQSIVLKSLMPICVKRSSVTETDVSGIEYTLPVYNITVFKKDMPVLLFYAANGLETAISFLGVDQAIKFKEEIDATDESNIYFRLSKSMFLEVNKEMFDKYTYIQAVTGMILAVSTNRLNSDILVDKEYWIKHLSNNNTYEKGKDVLTFFNRMLDTTTKKILKIEDYHKKDIYTLLRWMIMNYNELRLKDNLNLNTKRLRCNEYVASELNKEFSKRLNRIIGYGNRATMQNYKDMFKFPGNILIQKMHSSGILRYDENINDMNFFSRFKFTNKGQIIARNSVSYWNNSPNGGDELVCSNY